MKKKWVFKDIPDEVQVYALKEELNINSLLCSLLVQRGINSFDCAKSFFRPNLGMLHDPFIMKGMENAVERLNEALLKEEKILIYGDYDVDGTTSVALMYSFLKSYSKSLFTYTPDRYIEGYGVSQQGINWAKEIGATLVIALDCGIRANENIRKAKEIGIDFIICDHHLPGEELPPAIAILDPKQPNCTYPYNELSGCGIGFKLLQAFCIQQGVDLNKLYQYIDLVAVSIASDIVPITGENRTLAFFGIKKLNDDPTPGLAALLEKSGSVGEIDVSKIVFGIGPRINAAGRIGHSKNAITLLTQQTKEDAQVYAEKLHLDNNERRSFDESITSEAIEMIYADDQFKSKKSTVLFKEDWHKGIIGIVASRCIERHYKPTVILTESDNKITGSARSVDGFDIYQALEKCSDHLIQFGGHKYAAGLTMLKENVSNFQMDFEHVVAESISDELLIPKIDIDLEISLDDIDFKFLNIIKQMGPFGPQNMQPVFCTKNIFAKNEPRVLKGKHLKIFVGQKDNGNTFDAIGFNLSNRLDQLDGFFDIVYTIEENHYRGKTTLQLNLKDLRVS